MTVTRKRRLLKTREAAKIARVKPRTVARWLRDGQLKGRKLNGHSWRIDEGDLEDFLAAQGEAPG